MRFKTPLETKDEYIHKLHHEVEALRREVEIWKAVARERDQMVMRVLRDHPEVVESLIPFS